MGVSTKMLGEEGERVAERWLRAQGWVLIERGFRCRRGEIDLLMRKGAELLVAEVKSRSRLTPEEQWASRWVKKKRCLRRALDLYLLRNSAALGWAEEIRLGIVYVTGGRVHEFFDEESFL